MGRDVVVLPYNDLATCERLLRAHEIELAIDRLDVQRNEDALTRSGNVIRMGVELTKFGRPVAYHLRVTNPADGVYSLNNSAMYERVPADEIYHLFVPHEPEQIRGIPWMHTAILRLQNLGGFEEAAVIAARVGASKMGFFKTDDGDPTALADAQDAQGNLIKEADPGVFDVLPPGVSLTAKNGPNAPMAAWSAPCSSPQPSAPPSARTLLAWMCAPRALRAMSPIRSCSMTP
mgnify:CR=1 FL=1